MRIYDQYQRLRKPRFAPPASVFGQVWMVLYAIIAVSYIHAGYLFITGHIPLIVFLPFVGNLVVNVLYTPIQFVLRDYLLATIDIIFVLFTLIWALWAIYPYTSLIALANIPYLLWVTFATVLQVNILLLNKSPSHFR